MAAAIPGVEIADNRHASGIGRPDGEANARHITDLGDHGSESIRKGSVLPFGEQIDVHLAQKLPEGIGILSFMTAVRPLDAQAIEAGIALREGHPQATLDVLEIGKLATVGRDQCDGTGVGLEGTDRRACARHSMRPQERKGIAMGSLGDRPDRAVP